MLFHEVSRKWVTISYAIARPSKLLISFPSEQVIEIREVILSTTSRSSLVVYIHRGALQKFPFRVEDFNTEKREGRWRGRSGKVQSDQHYLGL